MKHEFYILKNEQLLGSPNWYYVDTCEKLKRVFVDDEVIISNPYLVNFGKYKKPQNITGFKTFLVSFENEGDGLDYHGETIIPSSSLPKFIQNIELTKRKLDNKAYVKAFAERKLKKEDCLQELNDLIELCKIAIEQNKFILHSGI